MKSIPMQPLALEAFRPYGRFASLTDPDGPAIGENPVAFFRDLLPLGSCGQTLCASVTQAEPMDLVVELMEFHTRSWEAFMTLDTESCICVAPATADARLDAEALKAFRVPPCTMIYLHPGVWHYAPYPLGGATLHSLVLLPERAYANDCVKTSLPEGSRVMIDR